MTVRIAITAMIAVGCSASSNGGKSASETAFSLFVTTELKGTIEPCGCNSDPLGDIARTSELITALRRDGRTALVVDAGSLLYSEVETPEHLRAQETLKADLITDIYRNTLEAVGIGLGPYDLSAGAAAVKPPRQVANLAADSGVALEPPKLVDIGGTKLGVFGVASPVALQSSGLKLSDPAAAAREAIETLRRRGARVIVGLAHMTRREAVELARAAPGIDFLVIGQNAPEPPKIKRAPTQVGSTYLVRPANRGQVVTRLDITLRDASGPLVDAVGEARAKSEIAALGDKITRLEADLAKWKADPSADPDFVAAKERELADLSKNRATLRASPTQIPDKGSYFTMAQIEIKKQLACHPEIQQAKQSFDKAAGTANAAAAKGKKPPAPNPGQAGYAGVEECEMCHAEASEFWNKTKHFHAWKTLVDVGKELDYSCISCHVTGWDQPGGSNLAYNEPLRAIQCEVCHGPGSLHVENDGEETPMTVRRTPEESLCVTCHNHEHSDTFDFQAYLRDVTGPGHGAEFRKKLGEGPTGHELRSAALEKAGKNIGTNCLK